MTRLLNRTSETRKCRVNAAKPAEAPPEASHVFGERLELAERFVGLLATEGIVRGLIGPREIERLWDRHVLNSAVLAELVPAGARVVDVGSGGGFPGVPLALVRDDITVTLLEPMARRIDWLREVVDSLELKNVTVLRGRAEEKAVRARAGGADVVTARAVAPLAKLADWCLPLTRQGGLLLALKGASAEEEIVRDRAAIRAAGGENITVAQCGAGVVQVPTTVVSVTKAERSTKRRR